MSAIIFVCHLFGLVFLTISFLAAFGGLGVEKTSVSYIISVCFLEVSRLLDDKYYSESEEN